MCALICESLSLGFIFFFFGFGFLVVGISHNRPRSHLSDYPGFKKIFNEKIQIMSLDTFLNKKNDY